MPIPRSLGDTEHEVAAALASMSASPPRFTSPPKLVREPVPPSSSRAGARPGPGSSDDNSHPTGQVVVQVEHSVRPSASDPAQSQIRTPPLVPAQLPHTPPSLNRKAIKLEASAQDPKLGEKLPTPSKTPKTPKRQPKPYARPARKSFSKSITLINSTPSESPPTSSSRLPSPEACSDSPTPRSTTRGRKLKPITEDEIKDLTPDEQVHVMTYSVKYQHKAATLFRALRDPNCHRITSKTILKPCETCTSQDWPCMLEVTNAFGLRKAVSRCTGCRHTRSTCSLKNQVKNWAEDDARMPWENEDGTPRDSSREPSCFPELGGRAKSWSASLPPAELDVAAEPPPSFSTPVALHLPPSVDPNISNFLYTMAPVRHHLPPSTSAAISALLRSVGGQHTPLEQAPAVYSRPSSPITGNYTGPPRPSASWEMDSFSPRDNDDPNPFYPPPPPMPSAHTYPQQEYRPSYHPYPYHDRHERSHSFTRHTPPYARGERSTPSYRYPSTESPSGVRLGIPLFDPAHDSMPPPSWRTSSYDALELDMGSAPRQVVPQIVVHPHSPCAGDDSKHRSRYYSPRPETPTPVRFARGSGPHDIDEAHTLLELGQSRSLSLPLSTGHRDGEYRDRSASPSPERAPAASRRPYWRTNPA